MEQDKLNQTLSVLKKHGYTSAEQNLAEWHKVPVRSNPMPQPDPESSQRSFAPATPHQQHDSIRAPRAPTAETDGWREKVESYYGDTQLYRIACRLIDDYENGKRYKKGFMESVVAQLVRWCKGRSQYDAPWSGPQERSLQHPWKGRPIAD